jgi:hypothetical protein
MAHLSFTEHPASVGETYLLHLRRASSFGTWMLIGGLAIFVNALFPRLLTGVGSNIVARLNDRMVVNRSSARQSVPVGEP